MSQQEFERADEEVMGIVNSAATPQSKQVAEAIEKKLNQQKAEKLPEDHDKIAEEVVSKVVVEEMHRKWKRNTIIARSIYALAGIAIACAMVVAMKMPACLAHIANAIILIGGIVAARQIEKIIKLLRK